MEDLKKNLILRDAVIINKNFEGREEKPYNPAGSRNFTVLLDGETSARLIEDGWNVKVRQRDDGSSIGYLRVAVSFSNPSMLPKIVQVTERANGTIKKTVLTENTIGNIDASEIVDIKLEIRPRVWSNNNGSVGGIKAYLKTMYFTLVKDVFEDDYPDDGDVPFEV